MADEKTKKCENHCPHCGAGDDEIFWGDVNTYDGGVTYRGECKKCEQDFEEHYNLVYDETTYEEQEKEQDDA